MPSDLLTDHQVAEMLTVSVGTVRRWRLQGVGPAWLNVGPRLVRYRRTDVEDWMRTRRRGA